MTVIEITSLINQLTDNSELNHLLEVIRDRQKSLVKSSINVGSEVWVVQKTKKTEGVVTKVNRTRAVVEMRGAKYNVPLTMIEVR